MEDTLYKYRYIAELKRVVDGDTIVVDLDLGLDIKFCDFKIRYARINAPELRGESREDGLKAKEFLEMTLIDAPMIVVPLKKYKDKYGRYLCEVYTVSPDGSWTNTNDVMVNMGHAAYYKDPAELEAEFTY